MPKSPKITITVKPKSAKHSGTIASIPESTKHAGTIASIPESAKHAGTIASIPESAKHSGTFASMPPTPATALVVQPKPTVVSTLPPIRTFNDLCKGILKIVAAYPNHFSAIYPELKPVDREVREFQNYFAGILYILTDFNMQLSNRAIKPLFNLMFSGGCVNAPDSTIIVFNPDYAVDNKTNKTVQVVTAENFSQRLNTRFPGLEAKPLPRMRGISPVFRALIHTYDDLPASFKDSQVAALDSLVEEENDYNNRHHTNLSLWRLISVNTAELARVVLSEFEKRVEHCPPYETQAALTKSFYPTLAFPQMNRFFVGDLLFTMMQDHATNAYQRNHLSSQLLSVIPTTDLHGIVYGYLGKESSFVDSRVYTEEMMENLHQLGIMHIKDHHIGFNLNTGFNSSVYSQARTKSDTMIVMMLKDYFDELNPYYCRVNGEQLIIECSVLADPRFIKDMQHTLRKHPELEAKHLKINRLSPMLGELENILLDIALCRELHEEDAIQFTTQPTDTGTPRNLLRVVPNALEKALIELYDFIVANDVGESEAYSKMLEMISVIEGTLVEWERKYVHAKRFGFFTPNHAKPAQELAERITKVLEEISSAAATTEEMSTVFANSKGR